MRLGRTIGTEWHGCGAPAGCVVMVKGDRDEPADDPDHQREREESLTFGERDRSSLPQQRDEENLQRRAPVARAVVSPPLGGLWVWGVFHLRTPRLDARP